MATLFSLILNKKFDKQKKYIIKLHVIKIFVEIKQLPKLNQTKAIGFRGLSPKGGILS